ncbi:hypothetical protein D9615_003764 [Tricholomella constricta]|uniref:Anaphase-promoting complex subunit 5 domain-containing protein n=1 Tax=Tricholomella constricta TaxID=117010 RepID=A0A8H5HHY1_9AGAR|nr:hypothetical protein D9615_003764 [Tricholomella constricta]
MADPITILTATLTFAACLKDITNLAKGIKEIIEKFPQNRKNARKLATEVLRDLLQLGKLDDTDHSHLLQGDPELEDALDTLRSTLRAIYIRCSEISRFSSQKAGGLINRAQAAFCAWAEYSKVEKEIVDLKESVEACHRRFGTFGSVRLLKAVRKHTDSIDKDINLRNEIQSTLSLILNERKKLMPIHNAITNSQTDSPTASPIQPLSFGLSKDEISALHLHCQVETVIDSLKRVDSSRAFLNEAPTNEYLLPFKTTMPRYTGESKDIARRHREVIKIIYDIIERLEDDSADLSIQDGAWRMINLAILLHRLELHSDALEIGIWTVKLYRILTRRNALIYEPYLILSLQNLARYKYDIDDLDGATCDIEECIRRQRTCIDSGTSSPHYTRLHLARSLIEYWAIKTKKGGLQLGFEVARESLDILESIHVEVAQWEVWIERGAVVHHAESPEPFNPRAAMRECPNPEWDVDADFWLQYSTGVAAHRVSLSLSGRKLYDGAIQADERALAIFTQLQELFPEVTDEHLAECYAHLSSAQLRNGRPRAKTLDYASRAIVLYRKLHSIQPNKHKPYHIEVMWDYVSLLHEDGRVEEALETLKEAHQVIRSSHYNPRLLATGLQQLSWIYRYVGQNEIAVTLRKEVVDIYRAPSATLSPAMSDLLPTTEPDSLCDLAHDLLAINNLDEAIAVCKEAVEKYRAIAKQKQDTCTALSLAYGLSQLCHCLNMAKKYDEALYFGTESIAKYRDLFRDGSSCSDIENYLDALQKTADSSCHAADSKAVLTITEVVDDYRMLAVQHRSDVRKKLYLAYLDRDFILVKHRQTREALRNTEELLEFFEDIPTDVSGNAADLMTALVAHALNLDDDGRTKEALMACQRAVDLGTSILHDNDGIPVALADARSAEASCLRTLGRYDEAVTAMETCVKLSRQHSDPWDVGCTLLASRLWGLAVDLRKARRMEEALELAHEAVNLCRGCTTISTLTEGRLPRALDTLAVLTADSGDEAKALPLSQEAIELYRKIKSNRNSLMPWAYVESSYAEALNTLASRLLATEDHDGAVHALLEAKDIYRDVVRHSAGQMPGLSKTLDLLAMCYCAAGQHEKEMEAARELDDQQRRLTAYNPDLAIVVQLAVENMRTLPSQQRLRHTILPCEHLKLSVNGVGSG